MYPGIPGTPRGFERKAAPLRYSDTEAGVGVWPAEAKAAAAGWIGDGET